MTEPAAAAPTGRADRRGRLITAGLELLEEHGPDALTTRKVSQRIGLSSQAVYSEFGSIGALVQGVAEEGFAALNQVLASVAVTEDPVRDLAALAGAYRAFALRRPRLYAAMYAMTQPGGYRRSGDELAAGADAFAHHVRAVRRAIAAGRFEPGDPDRIGLALWTAAHGWVAMELAGYTGVFGSGADTFGFAVQHILQGFGDDAARARASVDAALAAAADRA